MGGGMRMKASDYSCAPLCAECHTVERAFERVWGVRFASVAAELRRAWRTRAA
jgi:hypothetical protein